MSLQAVHELYERFPYPNIPLLARVRLADTHLANYQACVSAAFGSTQFAVGRPRILVVGAGTFEPYVVARANPEAEIWALDFSAASLRRLRWRLRLHGLSHRVKSLEMNLLDLGPEQGNFHLIFATGVLHHLPDPHAGLKALTQRLAPFGVLRAMLYSKFSRTGIYRLQALRRALQLREPQDLRRVVQSLPADHPLRLEWALYADTTREGGIQDGFFISEDHPFDALSCAEWLEAEAMVATKFLHSGSAELAEAPFQKLQSWQMLGARDRVRDLESNYAFLAVRRVELDVAKEQEPPSFLLGNPVLQRQCPHSVYSRLLGRRIALNRPLRKLMTEGMKESIATQLMGAKQVEALERAMLVLRGRPV